MEYLYRSDKSKYRYHIAAGEGTACKLHHSTCFRLINTRSDQPPANRELCSTCSHLTGVTIPVVRGFEQPILKRPTETVYFPQDKLLAHFGVFLSKNQAEYKAATIRLCQEWYVKMEGRERPHLTWEAARSALGTLKAHNVLPPIPGKKSIEGKKHPPKPLKQSRAPKRLKKSCDTLTPERKAYIASNDFLESFEWRTLRYEALKLSNGSCCLCGRGRPHGVILNVDHIKPRRKFPELALEINNLQILCGPCNHGKGNWDQTDWR